MPSSQIVVLTLAGGTYVMHGREVHSSIGGREAKFMHGASGPQREGSQLSTCPAMRGHNLSVESDVVAIDAAMGSGLLMAGELLNESKADSVFARSSFVISVSPLVRELFRLDSSMDERFPSRLSNGEKGYWEPE